MGSKNNELTSNQINIESLSRNVKSFTVVYYEDIDTLMFQPEKPIPAISVDCNGDVYLRVNPENKEIVGIEIEDFEQYFIVKYPVIAPIWKEAKRKIKRNRLQNESLTAFLAIFEEMLNEIVSRQDCLSLCLTIA